MPAKTRVICRNALFSGVLRWMSSEVIHVEAITWIRKTLSKISLRNGSRGHPKFSMSTAIT